MIEARRYWITERPRLREVAADISRLDVGPGRAAEIIVRPLRTDKTHDQRKTWHVLVGELGTALGYTPREMKEVIKREYYGIDVVTLPRGARYEIVQSSEDEDRAGYARLIDFTLQFAAEQGIHLEIKPKI